MEKWICCGHDIVELCNRAGCLVPGRCFFCGEPRKTVTLFPQPEDWLAFELAELWAGKIRELHGDPESHFSSLDQYGRPDVEAWRVVARRVFGLIGRLPGPVPDSQSTRDRLLRVMQAYAAELKAGDAYPATVEWKEICNALDRHELEVKDRALFDLVSSRLKGG